MIFKYVKFKNFLSYGNAPTTFNFQESQVSVITGSNGQGKSSILDAIYFGLIGKPYRNVNKNKLINTKNKKDCLVELCFEVGGCSYLVKRGIKPNLFEIYKDEELINEDSHVRDYQAVLENITGLNDSTIEQLLIISNRFYKPFLTLSASDKREFVETMFGIKLLSTMNDSLKIRVNTLKQEELLIQKDIEKIDSNILLLETHVKNQESVIDKATIEQSIFDSETKIEELKGEANSKTEEVEVLKNSKKELELKISNKSEYTKKKILCEEKIRTLQKEIKFFESNDSCPTCEQQIDSTFKSDRLDSDSVEIEKWIERKTTLENKLEKFKLVEDSISKLVSQINSLQMEISSINIKMKNEQEKIIGLKKQSIKQMSVDLDNDNKILSLRDEKNRKLEDGLKISNDKKNVMLVQKLISDKGLRKYLVGKYIPMFNQYLNDYLQMLSAKYQIIFDDEFNEKIVSSTHDDLDYGSFSSGEKQRCDLAIMFAFLQLSKIKNNMTSNLLCCDELFVDLDEEGVVGLSNVFDLMKNNGYCVLLITHDEKIKGLGDRNYVVKKNKFSVIEEEV